MGVIKIIKDYPSVFSTQLDKNYTREEAIRLIAAALSQGSELQKDISLLRDTYHAVWRLIDFGFRETSVQLAESLVKQAEWYQKYSIAQDICEELEMYYSLFKDREAVEKYANLYLKYKEIRENEYKAKKLYKEIVYCYKRGLHIDTDRIMSILLELEEKLPKDNLCYHHIFFEFKSLILEGEELEELYLEAISYFESLHFRHTTYISVFIRDLIGYYIDSNQPVKAEALIRSKEGNYTVGSTPWFRFMMIKCNYLLNQKDKNTLKVVQAVTNHAMFAELPEDTKIEWNVILESSIKISSKVEIKDNK